MISANSSSGISNDRTISYYAIISRFKSFERNGDRDSSPWIVIILFIIIIECVSGVKKLSRDAQVMKNKRTS